MSRLTLKLMGCALAIAPVIVRAQSSAKFEAVSIKPNRSGAAGSETDTTPGRLSLVNVTPLSILLRAFGVLAPQIAGAPAWILTERYDVIAVTGSGDALTNEARQPFLQALLADRWQFRYHSETRDIRGYSLIVAKNGTKITAHSGPGEYAMKIQAAEGRLILRSTRGNMGRLAEILSGQTNSLVTNDTGLSGEYDFTLEWVPDQNPDVSGSSLFTSLQEQLGLRLQAERRPAKVIVIDRIERPSEN